MTETSILGVSRQKVLWLEVLFLLVAVALAYGSTLQFQFIYDDHRVIEQNAMLKHASSMAHYFTGDLWQQSGSFSLYYRPIFAANWFLLYRIFGTAPWGWHLDNILLHAINVLLVFALARKMLKHGPAAWLAALLFALHPVHVEAVSWVSASCDMLMTGFALAALLCYLKSKDEPTTALRWNIASYALFLLCMGSKEPGITVLAMVGAYEWWMMGLPPGRSGNFYKFRQITPVMLPWIALALIYLFIRHIAVGMYSVMSSPNHVVAMTWPWLLWFYIKKLIWPVESSLYYDAEYVDSFSLSLFWTPVLCVFAVTVCAWFLYSKSQDRRIPVLMTWMWLPILPQWNLRIFPDHDFAHDRYLYLPSVAFCLLIGLAWSYFSLWMQRYKVDMQKCLFVTSLFAYIVFVPLTVLACSNWADDILLFSHAAKVASKYNAIPLTSLGGVLLKNDNFEEALRVYTVVEQIKPDWGQAKFNTGIALYDLQRYTEADRKFYEALMLPKMAAQEPLLYMGLSRMRMGRPDEAESSFRQAWKAAIANSDAEVLKYQLELALCLEQLGQKNPTKAKEALLLMQEIQEKDPTTKELKKKIETLEQMVEQNRNKEIHNP